MVVDIMPIHANVRVETALSQGQSQGHVTDYFQLERSFSLYKSGYSCCIIMLKVEFAEILSLNSAG